MSHHRLLHDLAFLTSDAAAGRLSGTSGAYHTALYLAAELEAWGYTPASEGSYFQSVDVRAARFTGQPLLLVNQQVFQHRRDYAEFASLSSGGSCTAHLIVVREDDLLDPRALTGKIVLIPDRPEGFDLNATVNAAADMGVLAVLIESGEPEWFHKTIYGGRGRIPVLRVRKSLAEKLAQRPDAHVELKLPFTNEPLKCNNVLGLLHGESTEFTLALTAHYDHLGDDPNGARFAGALDNGSGVAVILEVARALAKHEKKLPFNVLIAFLTGEESGLWGARHFVANQPLPISAAINLDSVGSEASLAAMRLGHKQRGDWMAELAEEVLLKRGIHPQWISGSDDSSAFISQGIPTVGLGQQPTNQKRSVMHTPFDTMETLHLETVQESVSLILELVYTLTRKWAGEYQIAERNQGHVSR